MGKVLILFEGKKLEPDVYDAILPVIAADLSIVSKDNTIICEYCTHIYKLYTELHADEGLDLIGLLTENLDAYPQLHEAIKDCEFPQDLFEAVYLLFDYDGHINMPRNDDGTHIDGDDAIKEMLTFFNNANDNGKLLISYPMVEAIKHLNSEPNSKAEIVTAKCKGPHCPNINCANRETCPPVRSYKGYVNDLFPHRAKLTKILPEEWAHIFKCHIKAAQLLTEIENVPGQLSIFDKQLSDYISQFCPQVAVLSSFPFLFIDFLGYNNLQERINNLITQD